MEKNFIKSIDKNEHIFYNNKNETKDVDNMEKEIDNNIIEYTNNVEIKDLGNKCFGINKIEDKEIIENFLKNQYIVET